MNIQLDVDDRRGRKSRSAVTSAEVDFCAYFMLTGNVKQASLQAGYSAWWGYRLLKTPRIQKLLAEFEELKKKEAWCDAKAEVTLSRSFLDELFIKKLVAMKTHSRTGDLAIVKMFETGYKRTGDIQPSRIVQQQKQDQVTLPNANAFQVYEAQWLRDRKARWAQELEAKHAE